MHIKHHKRWVQLALGIAGLLYLLVTAALLLLKPYYMNPEYPMWWQVREHTRGKQLPGQLHVAYLGDSRAKAALRVNAFEAATGLHTVNLTLGGATPVEGYHALKNLLRHRTPQYALLSYAPHHLTVVDTYWNRAVKFNFLRLHQYHQIARQAHHYQDSRLTADHYLNYFLKPGLYLSDAWHGVLQRRWQSNARIAQELKTSGGHYFFGREPGFSGLNEEVHDQHFQPSPLIRHYMLETIRLAQEHGIRLYWYSMPFNRSSLAALNPDYTRDYHAYLQSLAGPHFVVLNQLYSEDDALFGDWSHLYLGADKVTGDIAAALCAALADASAGCRVPQGG